MEKRIKTANTILYCGKFEETVEFYRDHLKLPVNFSTDWFVEFCLSTASRLSIADEKRASIKSCRGQGVTLALEVVFERLYEVSFVVYDEDERGHG